LLYSNLGGPNPRLLAQAIMAFSVFFLAIGFGKKVPSKNATKAIIKYFQINIIFVVITFTVI
jgi:hypothetical protein